MRKKVCSFFSLPLEGPKGTLALFFHWIPNTSSSVYYRRRVKIIIILYISSSKLIWICSFPPSSQPATLATTHSRRKTRFLLVCGERDPLSRAGERREAPAFLLFRKAILVRSPPSLPCLIVVRRTRRKSPQGRLPFLLLSEWVCGTPRLYQPLPFFFILFSRRKRVAGTPSILRDKWATHGVLCFPSWLVFFYTHILPSSLSLFPFLLM